MYTFYPGPSKIYPQLKEIFCEVFDSGILEKNHRSSAFEQLLQETKILMKQKLNIPNEFEIYFTSSATECWEIAIQSLFHGKMQFLYNGAFGKKWFKYAVTNPDAPADKNYPRNISIRGTRFFLDQTISEVDISSENQLICLTQNETSNGSKIDNDELRKIDKNTLKFIDATSSLGGADLSIADGDLWLASVQKCLGMPSGMGLMIVSPKALATAQMLNERDHYNSLLFIKENFDKNQTPYTPSILHIALLHGLLKQIDGIDQISKRITNRAEIIYNYFTNRDFINPLIANKAARSETVVCLETEEKLLQSLKQNAEKKGIILGNGYGEWKNNTFRIANFPAITDNDFDQLFDFFDQYQWN